jgi:hypothetical protein
MKPKKIKDTYRIVESLVNQERYYTNAGLPTKTIDGKVFIGVKKSPESKDVFFMLRENLRFVNLDRR